MNKIVLILIAVVLVGIAGFAALWFGVGSDLQERAVEILVNWREGRMNDVYSSATRDFQEGRTYDQFFAYLAYWRSRRGRFEEVDGRTHVSTSSGDDGSIKSVTLRLRFERGPAVGHFVFQDSGPTLWLKHISIREPAKAVDKGDVGVLDATVHSLFMLYNEKNYVGLYAALSPELQMAWPPARLHEQLDRLHAKGGRIDENFAQSDLVEEDDGDRRIVVYDVKFERTPGTAKVGFQWDADHWRVVTFLLRPGL